MDTIAEADRFVVWKVLRRGEVPHIAHDGMVRMMGKRELQCPKGHRIDLTGGLHLDHTVEVRCPVCADSYPLDLSEGRA